MTSIDEQVSTMRSLTESHDWADMNAEVSLLIETIESRGDVDGTFRHVEGRYRGSFPLVESCSSDDPIFQEYNRQLVLERFPMVTAAVIDYSQFYHSEHGAPYVLWCYLNRTYAASEWHFHMASVGKMSLTDANDEMVWRAVECAYWAHKNYEDGSPGFLKAMEWVERGQREFANR